MEIREVEASGDPYTDGLVYGVAWAENELTFSFPGQTGWGYVVGEPFNDFATLNAAQQDAVRAIFAQIASFTNLTFTEKTGTQRHGAVLRFGLTDDTETAHAYLPEAPAIGGDSWYANDGTYDDPVKGTYAWFTFMHEIGHALGLTHPHDGDALGGVMPAERDTVLFTVMSYKSYVGSQLDYYNIADGQYPQSFMVEDLKALQYLYGANYSYNATDTTYSWSETTGEFFINGAGQGVPFANKILMTLWDGGGVDTLDLSGYVTDLKISLEPGAGSQLRWTQAQTFENDNRVSVYMSALFNGDTRSLIENVIGGSGNDTITGNAAPNRLDGGAGNDYLIAIGGNDTFMGSPGSDTFVLSGPGDTVDPSAATTGLHTLAADFSFQLFGGIQTGRLLGSGNFALTGTSEGNYLGGNTGNNIIEGLGGDDQIESEPGDDRVLGGDGNDEIWSASGNDYVDGGPGNDYIEDWEGDDIFLPGTGVDQIWSASGRDIYRGTVADLAGDQFDWARFGIRVQITDANLDNVSLAPDQVTVTKGGASIQFAGYAQPRLAAFALAGGGVELLSRAITGAHSLDQDGFSDILWRHGSGAVTYWSGRDGGFDTATGIAAGAGSDWTIIGSGNFDDGVGTDLLWRNSSGLLTVWDSAGGGLSATSQIYSVGLDWQVVATGHFTPETISDDILWRNSNGALALWHAGADGFVAVQGDVAVASDWQVAGVADFDGNGSANVLWRNTAGAITLWEIQSDGASFHVNTAFEVFGVGLDWEVAGFGDFDGNGSAEILWRNTSGALTMWHGEGAMYLSPSQTVLQVDPSWEVASVGYYNADGLADILWRHTSGALTTWTSTGSGFTTDGQLFYAGLDWEVIAP